MLGSVEVANPVVLLFKQFGCDRRGLSDQRVLIPGAHTLFEPGEAGVARASPHFNPVVPYYAAGRDPSWYEDSAYVHV